MDVIIWLVKVYIAYQVCKVSVFFFCYHLSPLLLHLQFPLQHLLCQDSQGSPSSVHIPWVPHTLDIQNSIEFVQSLTLKRSKTQLKCVHTPVDKPKVCQPFPSSPSPSTSLRSIPSGPPSQHRVPRRERRCRLLCKGDIEMLRSRVMPDSVSHTPSNR